MLLLLASIHIHAPGVEGEGEEVLQARGRTRGGAEALQPFLALFEGGELAPEGVAHTRWRRLTRDCFYRRVLSDTTHQPCFHITFTQHTGFLPLYIHTLH